jgi:hypothetical protein
VVDAHFGAVLEAGTRLLVFGSNVTTFTDPKAYG